MEVTRSIKGANVENNKFCVSVHYRNVDPKVELDIKFRISCLPWCNNYTFMPLIFFNLGLEIGHRDCRRCPESFSSSQTNNRAEGRKIPVVPSHNYCSLESLTEYASPHPCAIMQDKGKAVEFLLQSLRLDDPESVLPIYSLRSKLVIFHLPKSGWI